MTATTIRPTVRPSLLERIRPWWLWLVTALAFPLAGYIAPSLLGFGAAASLAVFAHADRHGNRHATAWGIATFLAAGIVVPIYFIRYWLRARRQRS